MLKTRATYLNGEWTTSSNTASSENRRPSTKPPPDGGLAVTPSDQQPCHTCQDLAVPMLQPPAGRYNTPNVRANPAVEVHSCPKVQ